MSTDTHLLCEPNSFSTILRKTEYILYQYVRTIHILPKKKKHARMLSNRFSKNCYKNLRAYKIPQARLIFLKIETIKCEGTSDNLIIVQYYICQAIVTEDGVIL